MTSNMTYLVLLNFNFIRNPFQAFNSIRKRLKNLKIVSKNIQYTVLVVVFIGLEDFCFTLIKLQEIWIKIGWQIRKKPIQLL